MTSRTPTYKSEKITVNQATLSSIRKYLATHSLGNRGVEDGDKRKQEVGLLGELLVVEKLTGKQVQLETRQDGFDGGYDLIYRGYRIDVKTMERKSYVRGDYVNNFYIMQEGYAADIIVFCSYNISDNILEICGWMFKRDLSSIGKYYSKGTKRVRKDGTFFEFRQDNYEVENRHLQRIEDLIGIEIKH